MNNPTQGIPSPVGYLFRTLAWGLGTCSIRCVFLITDSGEKWWCPWCSPGGHVVPKWCLSVVHAVS